MEFTWEEWRVALSEILQYTDVSQQSITHVLSNIISTSAANNFKDHLVAILEVIFNYCSRVHKLPDFDNPGPITMTKTVNLNRVNHQSIVDTCLRTLNDSSAVQTLRILLEAGFVVQSKLCDDDVPDLSGNIDIIEELRLFQAINAPANLILALDMDDPIAFAFKSLASCEYLSKHLEDQVSVVAGIQKTIEDFIIKMLDMCSSTDQVKTFAFKTVVHPKQSNNLFKINSMSNQ